MRFHQKSAMLCLLKNVIPIHIKLLSNLKTSKSLFKAVSMFINSKAGVKELIGPSPDLFIFKGCLFFFFLFANEIYVVGNIHDIFDVLNIKKTLASR